MIDDEPLTSRVEARKYSMRQTDKGSYVTFEIIGEAAEDIFADPHNQRYHMVILRVNDQEEPIPSKRQEMGVKAINLAMALCRDEEFQMWMVTVGYAEEPTQEAAITGLKEAIGIQSRKELKSDKEAQRRLAGLRDEFAAHYRR